MDPDIREAWTHLAAGRFAQARACAERNRLEPQRRKLLARIRRDQTRRISELWADERRNGAYSPAIELVQDLDEWTFEHLDALMERIQSRIASRDPDLPLGWQWIAQWQGQHPDGRTTALYLDRERALREMRRKQKEWEREEHRRVWTQDDTDELFTERSA
jgi:hypothetical protein